MSEAREWADGPDALVRLEAAVHDLLGQSLTACTEDEVLTRWQRLEAVARQLAAVEHTLIAEVSTRRLDFSRGCTSVAGLARQLLRVPIREARARVRAAEAAGPRASLTGEPLEPLYPAVSAAQAAGVISPAHARVVVDCVDKLPAAVQAEHARPAERLLVDQAAIFDPDTLANLARRLIDTLNPDGDLDEEADRQRRRDLTARQLADGTGIISGRLTAEAMEHLLTTFDTLGRPKPAVDGTKDPRTAGQRRHDALLEMLKMVERSDQLPHSGGITTTVILTTTRDQWDTGTGLATTGHGATVPVREAKRWVDGESRVIAAVFDRVGAIWGYSNSHRLFTENQRLAMAARDKGCCFPGCDAPVHQCQSQHMREHCDGGETSVCNGCLMCAYHHRHFDAMGWAGIMINGRPWWIPPRWIDPEQEPVRNTIHDPAPDLVPI